MVGEEGTSNGEGAKERVQHLNMEAMDNGFGNDGGDASSGGSEGFRTYKRRRNMRSSSDSKGQEDGKCFMEAASRLSDQTIKVDDSRGHRCGNHASMNHLNDVSQRQWRKFVLDHMYQSLSNDENGIQGCLRGALMMAESGYYNADKSPLMGQMANGTHSTAKGHAGVLSNGALDESRHHSVPELCQHAFLSILLSEKFTSLCKLLFENFQGMKTGSILSLSFIDRRMKDGAYDHSPMLFCEDIEQFWRKLQGFGAELISLSKSLSDISKTCCNERVGGSVRCIFEDEKHGFCTKGSDSHGQPEQKDACCVYRVCSCRRCGEKADGRDCLVCDSCEEMYHVSCIEPAVKEIPPKSWYCDNCAASGMGSIHENCVACERLNCPRTQINQAGDEIGLSTQEPFNDFEEASNFSTNNEVQLSSEGTENKRICKICGSPVSNGEKINICDHSECPGKYYHVRCLTNRQLILYGPRWYCPSCLCRGCLTDKDDDKIVLCDGCDHAYHLYCMIPPRISVPKGKWFCRRCDLKIQKLRRVRRAYEKSERYVKKKGEGVKKECENRKKLYKEGGEESDKGRDGMDMLVTAALKCEVGCQSIEELKST
ncbi:PHD finger protein EHD3-like [Populus nigra]|uniref:PHD finger protein EHD3-like n=1 Tax=Populus nigra TaxID=3691 RepID=UPI002B27A6DC|nr:PHD finger protein EHD3-like [Populus nigra]XP_061972031.1 PHD finger protein EHD3-like [Populus nigra]